ncbi:MAG: phosphate propanoyltransferase [Bacilli bacterium]|jgi:propanediol utilization protein|nr:phosphate propanoyltransferase [Bacilli bacterium]
MSQLKTPIEISAKHLHLCQEHVDILFGKNYQLTKKRELSQKNYFVTEETVEVIGSKGSDNFSILIPLRKKTQVELAITDAIKLGLDQYIRDSGDIKNTGSCILKGPKGQVKLEEGVIIAARHIHMNTNLAAENGLKDGDHVSVEIEGERALIFKKVTIRTDESFNITMHIDTDEGNAANINNKKLTYGKITKED